MSLQEAKSRIRNLISIDDMLTEDELAIRKMVNQFVAKEVLPDIERHFSDGTFPIGTARRVGSELGLFGCTLPEKYGGSGVSHTAYGLANQELEYGGSGWRSLLSVQSGLVMYPVYTFGSEEQRQKYLPRLASGEIFGCFGLTEPGAGSDPASMKTTLKKRGDKFILNGAKAWITNGTLADVAVIWARNDDGRVQGVLVEKGQAGFESQDEKHKFSLRASITSHLSFRDVEISPEALLPEAVGLGAALDCLNQARFSIAWGTVGSAVFTFEQAVAYALEREQFGRPIAGFQLQQEKIAWMATEISKALLLCQRLGQLKAAGKIQPAHISMAKRNNVYIARECARMAREIHGSYGISGEYPVWRHLADLESVYTYEGTHDIHTLVLGEAVTGIPAYR